MRCEKILLPVVSQSGAKTNFDLAMRLLGPQGKIVALRVVRVPDDISLSEGAGEAVDSRADLDEISDLITDKRIEFKPLVRVAHRVSEGIVESAAAEKADLLILPWKGCASAETLLFGRTIDRLVDAPPCNLLVARVSKLASWKKILLPVRGGPFAEFALQIAEQLALSLGAAITVLHCEGRFTSPQFNEALYDTFLSRMRFQPHVHAASRRAGRPAENYLGRSCKPRCCHRRCRRGNGTALVFPRSRNGANRLIDG